MIGIGIYSHFTSRTLGFHLGYHLEHSLPLWLLPNAKTPLVEDRFDAIIICTIQGSTIQHDMVGVLANTESDRLGHVLVVDCPVLRSAPDRAPMS